MRFTKDRIQKILEYASIKLSSVVYLNHFVYTTIFGSISEVRLSSHFWRINKPFRISLDMNKLSYAKAEKEYKVKI